MDYNNIKDENYLKYVSESLTSLLSDILLSDSISLSGNSIIEASNRILNLSDEAGNPYFRLDSNYNFDQNSKELLKMSFEKFKEELSVWKELLGDEVDIVKINNAMKLIEETVYTDNIFLRPSKVSFITLPVNDKSILDYDIMGKNATFEIGKETFKTNAPNNYKFGLNSIAVSGHKTNAEHILSELESIEDALKDGQEPVVLSKKHSPFQTEHSTFVRKNRAACTRIPFEKYGEDNIIIFGIFHKEGNNDDDVQDEYDNRHEILSKIPDKEKLIKEGKRAYLRFKGKLISAIYGDKLETKNAILQYLLEKAELRLNYNDNERGAL